MNYQETIDYLYSHLPVFHLSGKKAYKADLANSYHLADKFNHPYTKYPIIHVAGTNGKGSSSHLLASILQEAGYKTGLHTSPHLLDFRERIRVNGEMIDPQKVIDFVENNKEYILNLSPSFFELQAFIAFCHFAETAVDIAIIETGLGGRLDTTNIIDPLISVITNIGLDHTDILGDNLPQIAQEKAGIIKVRKPVIIGETHPETEDIFKKKASEMHSKIVFADQHFKCPEGVVNPEGRLIDVLEDGKIRFKNMQIGLSGSYQLKNIKTVLATTNELTELGYLITEEHIIQGIAKVKVNTGLRGRWETLMTEPLIICDVAHNKEGIRYIAEQLKATKYKKIHFIIGVMKDKDVQSILSILPREALYYFTKANTERALNENDLQASAIENGLNGLSYKTVHQAIEAALLKVEKNDLIFIGGSTFVVAEIMGILNRPR